jgi:electron transfer flavoprotein beta subunit
MSDMFKLVVCIKQVPMVSELPWDPQTGALKRDLAEGMMNPACQHALEAALQIKERHGAYITVITMGPPMAEEVLHEAIAMGADRGLLLSDRQMAGADTFATSYTLARAIEHQCRDFDLVLCGFNTSDSETAQVGPQLAEELNIPSVAHVDHIELTGRVLRMQRLADHFLETMEIDLPGLISVTTQAYAPRYISLGGLEGAFANADIAILDAQRLGLDPVKIGQRGSATQILNVYPPTAGKKNIVLKGTPKEIVKKIFEQYEDMIGAVIGKDLKSYE